MNDLQKHIGQCVKIPEGTFLMGSTHGLPEESPVHDVYTDAFMMDVCPVTNYQFKGFVQDCPAWQKDNGIRAYLNTYYLYIWRQGLVYPKGKRDHPAVYMNWYAAAAYCNWRSKKEGLEECYDDQFNCRFDANGYRLPTEAEFEKAARGGVAQDIYPWGNDIDKTKANYDNNIGDTVEVTKHPPNGYGLYAMSGNIGHWCNDWYDAEYYKTSPDKNPRGPKTGTHKVYRGGAWGTPANMHRNACRFWQLQVNCNPDFGFRCVRKV